MGNEPEDDFTPEGIKALITAHHDALDDWNQARGIRTERMDMKEEIEALLAERLSAQKRIAELEAEVVAERTRIADLLDEEADLTPCSEDAMVTRSNARLIRANFSYEDAERLEIDEEARALLSKEATDG